MPWKIGRSGKKEETAASALAAESPLTLDSNMIQKKAAPGCAYFRSSSFHLRSPAYGTDNEEYVEAVFDGWYWTVRKVSKYQGLSLASQAKDGPVLETADDESRTTSLKILKATVCFFEALFLVSRYEQSQEILYRDVGIDKLPRTFKEKFYVDAAHEVDVIFNTSGLPCLTESLHPVIEDDYPEEEMAFLERRRIETDEERKVLEAQREEERRRAAEEKRIRKEIEKAEQERREKLPVAIDWDDESLRKFFNVEADREASANLLRDVTVLAKTKGYVSEIGGAVKNSAYVYYNINGSRSWSGFHDTKRFREFSEEMDKARSLIDGIPYEALQDDAIKAVIDIFKVNFLILRAAWCYAATRDDKYHYSFKEKNEVTGQPLFHTALDDSLFALETFLVSENIDSEQAAKIRTSVIVERSMTELVKMFDQFKKDADQIAENLGTASQNLTKIMKYGTAPQLMEVPKLPEPS